MLRRGTKAYYSRLYNVLYDIGQRILDNHNPCEIKDGRCAGRSYSTTSFCCFGCSKQTKTGCKAKALWCKLWLCYDRKKARPEVARKLAIIERVAIKLMPRSYISGRCSKNRFMKNLRIHHERA